MNGDGRPSRPFSVTVIVVVVLYVAATNLLRTILIGYKLGCSGQAAILLASLSIG